MKKLIMIALAAAVMSCGDGRNSASENNDDIDNGTDNTEVAEPDSTMNQSDTTSMGSGERGTTGSDASTNDASTSGRSGTSDSRNQRDSIK